MGNRAFWIAASFVSALFLVYVAHAAEWVMPPPGPEPLPNTFFIPNPSGAAATFSEEGFLNRADDFHTPQGTNGRSCASCHAAEAGWSVTPMHVKRLFLATNGLDPLFHPMDANRPDLDLSTVAKRRQGYSMLLEGLFRRGGALREDRDFDIIAVDDPHGVGSTTFFSFYRRPLTIANLKLSAGVHWDGRFNIEGDGLPPRPGLFAQARGNIINGQQAPQPPSDALVNAIVDDELQLWHAQTALLSLGRLDTCGARGGPEFLSQQPYQRGRFDLYDAWLGFVPGKCDPRPSGAALRAQIARGQEIFNTPRGATGRSCLGCHDVANNGSNLENRFFDIGVSGPERRMPGMPIYTVRERCPAMDDTCATVQTTDPGRALITMRFADINKFKVPTLRGVAARAPYFHNGTAKTLRDVVRHYSELRGFDFTQEEEDDLVTFLSAL